MGHWRVISILGISFISALLFAANATGCAGTAQARQFAGGVPSELLAKFHRGINVTRWFCYLADPGDTSHFKSYMVDEDFATFKRLKITWIRLCVSPEAVYSDGQPNSRTLPYLDAAVDTLHKNGLAVVIDLHDNGQMKLDQPGTNTDGFVSFWRSMAQHYLGKGETYIVFELLNEPQFNGNAEPWNALQEKAVAAVRGVDPKRTIMVTPNGWSGIEPLRQLPKLAESNLLYTFHCYDPFLFTHQGASWVGDPPRDLKSMPFPASPDAVADALAKSPAAESGTINWYGKQRFDAAYLKDRLAKSMEYGVINHVPVVLGEFGAYPPVSPPDSRARWFEAMATAIRELGVPNALWGYDDGLGLGRERSSDGKLKLDPVTLKGLYGFSD